MRIFAAMAYDKMIGNCGMIKSDKNNNSEIETYIISNKRFTFGHQ